MFDINEKLKKSNIELIQLIKSNVNSVDNLEKLYFANKGFIYQTIRKRIDVVNGIDDLLQESFIALVKTVELYDDTREQTNFLQLLKWSIYNRINNLNNGLPVHLKNSILKYKRIRNKIVQELGYDPSDEEMMILLNIDYEKLIRIKQNLYESISLNDYISDEENAKKIDRMVDSKAHVIAQDNLEQSDIKIKIQGAINQLPSSERTAIIDIYLLEKPYDFIAEELNVNSNYVGTIANKGLRLLRKNKKFLSSVSSYVNDYDINYYSRKPIIDIIIENDEIKSFQEKQNNIDRSKRCD